MLVIKNLSVAFGSRPILTDINLEIRTGQVMAIIGPNGAGKSTLIRAMSGVVPQRSGKVTFKSHNLLALSPAQRARLLAVVPQARELPGDYTVAQTVLLGRTPYLNFLGIASPQDYELVRQALESTQLADMADRLVGELSGGEQQRVLLARALAQDTPLLLLDEPTTHLDLQHQSSLLNLVRRLAREKDLAVLMVLHELNHASLYADQVALLAGGRITAVGTPSQVLTSDLLTSVYKVPVNVIPHPEYGSPLVLPDGFIH